MKKREEGSYAGVWNKDSGFTPHLIPSHQLGDFNALDLNSKKCSGCDKTYKTYIEFLLPAASPESIWQSHKQMRNVVV
ncbi:hypothetical protein [Nostoc sp.]|uniref:hypothetical protein n=1 Tax=Nostoc sp. TaxID=1180 RepID=UPI002FFD115A